MKKTLLTVASALALTTIGAQAQGMIDFNNLSAGAITVSTGGFAAGAVNVGFYWLAGSGASTATVLSTGTYFQPAVTCLGAGVTVSEPNQDNLAGSFFGDVLTVPGTAAGNYSLVVVAFSGAATYTAALSTPGAYRGNSAAFNHTLVTGATPPTAPNMPTFAIAPVPEPSTFALAGLGLAGLLIFRRRK